MAAAPATSDFLSVRHGPVHYANQVPLLHTQNPVWNAAKE